MLAILSVDNLDQTHLTVLDRIIPELRRQVEEDLGIGLGKVHRDAAQGSGRYWRPAGRDAEHGVLGDVRIENQRHKGRRSRDSSYLGDTTEFTYLASGGFKVYNEEC